MFRSVFLLISILMIQTSSLFPQESFDILIKKGFIIDGSGQPGYMADIGIRDGKIAAIGTLEPDGARKILFADGRVVTPGFIDMMGETSIPLLKDPASAGSKLRQGITTMLVGEGLTVAPQHSHSNPYNWAGENWESFAEYFEILERKGVALNVLHTVGATTVRDLVLGSSDKDPTPEQLQRMKEHVARAMQEGAAGVASALIYPPAVYAKTEELIAMCRTAAGYGGVYFTHIRNEGNRVLEALEEAIRIGEEASIPVHIYHMKAAGPDNWPLMNGMLERIRDGRSQGVRITADVYPYLRAGLSLRAFIHPSNAARGWVVLTQRLKDPRSRRVIRQEMESDSGWENYFQYAGSDWSNVLVKGLSGGGDPNWVGLSVQEIAGRRSMDVWDVFFDLVLDGASAAPQIMDEEQKRSAIQAPFVCFGCDAAPTNPGRAFGTHPRAFGTFPRVLSKYVREERIIRLEEAIRKMTSLPADILNLEHRGFIRVGDYADIVLFDPSKIEDRATYTQPLQYAQGVDFLIINGRLVIDEGTILNVFPGMVLRHRKSE
jgi:N-acyl-D-amino-acid deacylase